MRIDVLLPQAIDLEEVVLGSILQEKDAADQIIPTLPIEVFYKEEHKLVYSAICKLFSENKPIDILTVTMQLKRNGHLEQVGGPANVSELTMRVGGSANTDYHAAMLIQQYIRRELINSSMQGAKSAYDQTNDVFALIDQQRKALEKIDAIITGRRPMQSIEVLSKESVAEYEKRRDASRNNQITGVPTGLTDLDKITGGWKPGDLIILAARPGMGKTALACLFAWAAAKNEMHSFVQSLEMPSRQLVDRLLLFQSGLPAGKFKDGYLSKIEEEILYASQPELAKLGIHIDDMASVDPSYVKARGRRIKKNSNLGLIIVDYLQLMTAGRDSRYNNREQEISSVSRQLKAMAKDLDVPVIALAQLSRAVETRGGDKRPQLSDLRESGAIEQDADMVIFPYRPEYYGIITDGNGESLVGVGELIIAKHRNGALTREGELLFRYNESLTTIRNIKESALTPNHSFQNQTEDDF